MKIHDIKKTFFENVLISVRPHWGANLNQKEKGGAK
jgi:hypothetical protein